MLYLFDAFVLDSGRRELRRGATLVSLEPQVFDLLVFLIGNRERVVSKADLIDAVWGGRIVSDSTVDSRVSAARRAVGDTGREQRLVRTIIGKGVRFVGATREKMPVSEPLVLHRAPPLSIIVLPFVNLSGDHDQDYFADGITDDLTTALSRLVNSFVIARTTAFTYKDKGIDVSQIGRDVDVRYVVEGAVRRTGQNVQVNVQLIDAETGVHLWAHRFDAERSALPETEDDIIWRIGRALNVQVLEAGARQSARQQHPDANDLIMRGWALYQRAKTPTSLGQTQNAFEQALNLEPSSVAAKIGLATTLTEYIGIGFDHIVDGVGISREEDIARSQRLLTEALEADPNHPMGHAAMGRLHRLQNRLADARIELEKAIELDRNNVFATLHLGITLLHLTKLTEARGYFEKTLLLAPLDLGSVFYYFWLGYCHFLLGNVDDAINFLRRSRAANPHSPGTHLILAAALGLKGDCDEARDALGEFRKLKPELRSLTRLRDANPNWTVTPEYASLREATVGAGLRRAGMPDE